MKHPIIDIANKQVGDIDLDERVFGAPERPDILSRVVNWHSTIDVNALLAAHVVQPHTSISRQLTTNNIKNESHRAYSNIISSRFNVLFN